MNSLSNANQSYAGFGRRFIAYVIDGMLISLITLIFQTSIGHNPLAALSLINQPEQLAALQAKPTYMVAQLSSYVIFALYLILFWMFYDGATPGKRLTGIRIVRDGQQKISLPTAVVRIFGMILSGIPLGLGYLWVIWDKKKQGWHDKIAQTYVVRTKATPNTAAIIIVFIIALLYQLFMFGAGAAAGFLAAKSVIDKRAQNTSAVKTFNESLDKLSPEAKAHYDRSQELFTQMREQSANPAKVRTLNDENIAELKKAIDLASDSARLWYDLGNAYTWVSNAGSLEDGLAAYGKAEELEPDNVIYVTSVGDMLVRMGKHQDAVLQLNKALRMNSNYAQPEYLIGVAYKNLNISADAKTHLTRAIEIWQKENDNGQFDDEILAAQQAMADIK